MAENPLRYQDLLQPDNSIEQAITQLQKLNETYSQTLKTVKDEAIKLQTSVQGVSGATEEHRQRIRNTATEADKLTKAQRDLEFAMSDTAKQIAELKEQQREAQNIAKLTAKLNNSEAGSYNALSAQYSLNKIQLNKLSQEYRENTAAGQKLVKETEEIYAKMKQLQAATGKYTLNVGNYKSAWDGLGVSAQQLVRELPSLAVSANSFFLAISNNIPMLVDEINKVKAANAAAAAKGEETVPVWKQVTKAFVSWNTVISLGITLLTVFGGDIIDWISKMVQGEKQADHMKEAMDGVNQAMQDGAKNAQQEIVRLNLLYNATQDTTKSINERKAAVDALQKEFPAYFKNISDEKILAGEAAGAYNELADAILRSARARAAEEKIVENQREILDIEEQRAETLKEQNAAQGELNRLEQQYQEILSDPTLVQNAQGYVFMIREVKGQVEQYGEEANAASKKIDALTEANKRLAGNIDTRDLTATPVQETKTPKKRTPRDRTQQTTRENNQITKQLYESQTALITDELEKQRQALQDAYNAEVADLRNKQKNDKDLTQQSREAINQIIINKQKKLQQDLAALDAQEQQRELQTQQQTLQLRLDATEQGSAEENDLRIQLLQNARQQELLENRQLAEDMRQDEADINAKYDKQILDQDRTFQAQRKMLQFGQQQALDASEFALLETTEEEKTRYKLQAEKERLQQLLELVKGGQMQMSDVEVQTVKNTIAKLDQEIDKSKKKEKDNRDIYDILGIKLTDEQKQGIADSVGFSIGQLQNLLDANVQLKEQALQDAQERTEAAKSNLEAEIEARNNGYANDVETARKELELAKQNEQKALKEKQKAQRQQQALDTVTQTSSLITATAEIWKSLAGIPVVGHALAVAAIATMWGSFAAAKIKARQVTKAEDTTYGEGGMEFLDGGSHQSGNDVDLGTTPDGRRRRAEGGEAFAIINKTSTRKYRKALPSIIKSINQGTFEKKYIGAFSNDGVTISVNGTAFDSQQLEKDVKEIKEQGKHRYMLDGNGRIIERYKNLKRTYN